LVFLGRQQQYYQNAGALRAVCPTADGGNKNDSSTKEIVCKYDFSDKAATDKLNWAAVFNKSS
jgi:hypothetical protein